MLFQQTAPRKTFTCKYCGASFVRRLSHVKNINAVFCNNECRAKYTEQTFKQYYFNNSDFNLILQDEKIQRIINTIVFQSYVKYLSARKYTEDELKQECLIAIWKYGNRLNQVQEKYPYIWALCKNRLKVFLRDDWKVDMVEYDDTNSSKNIENPEAIISTQQILNHIYQRVQQNTVYAMFYRRMNGSTIEDIARDYGVEKRTVTVNICNCKRQIKRWLS